MKQYTVANAGLALVGLLWLPPAALAVRSCFCNEIRPACSQHKPPLVGDECFVAVGGDSIYVAIPYTERGKAEWQPYSSGICIWQKGVKIDGVCTNLTGPYEDSAPGSQSSGANCNGTCPVQPGG